MTEKLLKDNAHITKLYKFYMISISGKFLILDSIPQSSYFMKVAEKLFEKWYIDLSVNKIS